MDGDGEGTEGKVCGEQLKSHGSFSPQERRLKGDIITLQSFMTLQPLMVLQLLITLQLLMALQFSHGSLQFLLGMELHQGRVKRVLGKGSATEGGGHGTGYPG